MAIERHLAPVLLVASGAVLTAVVEQLTPDVFPLSCSLHTELRCKFTPLVSGSAMDGFSKRQTAVFCTGTLVGVDGGNRARQIRKIEIVSSMMDRWPSMSNIFEYEGVNARCVVDERQNYQLYDADSLTT
jgi:hypothetical protein